MITQFLCTLPSVLRREKINYMHLSLAVVIDHLKAEASLTNICRHTGMHASNTWIHLGALSRKGLISFRKGRGRRNIPTIIYYLTPKGAKKIASLINRATKAAKQLNTTDH